MTGGKIEESDPQHFHKLASVETRMTFNIFFDIVETVLKYLPMPSTMSWSRSGTLKVQSSSSERWRLPNNIIQGEL